MTSKRVYKEALPFEEAIERIKKASGTQFDPMVVETFVNIPVEEWKNIRKMVANTGSQYLKGLMFELSKPRF
jgi:response regulator RpfG family c-di-GMP phosphodiesterase